MLIPDMITDYLLPKSIVNSYIYWNIINPIRLSLASFGVMVIHIIAVKEVQKLTNIKAIIVTILSYIPYVAITLTYMR